MSAMAWLSTSNYNIAVACTVCFLVNSALYPASSIQYVVISDSSSDLKDSNIAYYSQAIVYAASILGSLCCSMLYDVVGIKATYGIGVVLYCVLYLAVIVLKSWALYTAAVLTGLGVGIQWVMGPMIIADNSTNEQLMRNFSIMQACLTLSIVVGSLCDYFYIEHLTQISDHQRLVIYSVCIAITLLATLIAITCIRYPPKTLVTQKAADNKVKERTNTLTRTQLLIAMVTKPEFYCCVIHIFYCGMVTSYIWMIFTTCIGATFDKRGILALAGIVIGISGMVGAVIWDRMGTCSLTVQTLALGLVASAAYILSFLIFPGDSPYNASPLKETYVTPSIALVLLISALLGASEAGFAVSANTAVGKVFSGYEDTGYMLLNVVWCSGTGIMFAVGPLLDIQVFLVLVLAMMSLTVGSKLYWLNNAQIKLQAGPRTSDHTLL